MHIHLFSDHIMVHDANMIAAVHELSVPGESQQKIAKCANMCSDERVNDLFKVNRRRRFKITDIKSGFSIELARSGYNTVVIREYMPGSFESFFTYATNDEFKNMLITGNLRSFDIFNKEYQMYADMLRQQVIDRWNSF